MMQNLPNRMIRFFRGLPRWLLSATIVVPIGFFGLGYFLGPTVATGNIRLFLSSLTTAQAGVLAIVFSITVIAIQLVSTRYSPRMVSLFIEAPMLKFTFWIFVGSIAFDLALLYLLPQTLTPYYLGGLFAAISISMIAVVSLYVFIRAFIWRSTPEGLIDTFVLNLTPEKYLRKCEEMVEDDQRSTHPLRPLYSMIMEALSNRERATADTALQEYGDIAETTLAAFIDQNVFERKNRHLANALYESVFKEQLHDIALHAEEVDESQLIGEATEVEYNLGKQGLESSDIRVSRQAIRGLTDLIIHAPVEENRYRVSNSAWDRLGDLLVDAAEYPRPNVVWSAASTIQSRVPWQLHRVPEIRRYEHSMTDLYRNMKQAHEHLLNHYDSDVASVEMEWQYEHVPDDVPNREVVSAVYKWREALFDSTTAFLHYRIEERRHPITEGNFRRAWQDICIQAADSEATEYAIVLCQALIEMAFIETVEQPFEQKEVHSRLGIDQDESRIFWIHQLAKVKAKGDSEVVDTAFEKILSYDYTSDEPPLMTIENMDETREKYYQNLLNVQEYSPLNTHSEFPDLIEELNQRADELAKEFE